MKTKSEATNSYQSVDDPDARFAIYILDPDMPSGCVEWPLVGWSDGPEGRWPCMPGDEPGEEGIWGSSFAVWDVDGWLFPDGERCDDQGLIAAFARREPDRDPPTVASRLNPKH
jgi:hypothetical protein